MVQVFINGWPYYYNKNTKELFLNSDGTAFISKKQLSLNELLQLENNLKKFNQ